MRSGGWGCPKGYPSKRWYASRTTGTPKSVFKQSLVFLAASVLLVSRLPEVKNSFVHHLPECIVITANSRGHQLPRLRNVTKLVALGLQSIPLDPIGRPIKIDDGHA